LDALVPDQLLPLSYDVCLELSFEGVQSLRASSEEAVHELDVPKLVVLEHVKQPRVLISQQSLGVVLDILSQELVQNLVLGGVVQVGVDSVRLLGQSGIGFRQVGVARILRDERVRLVPVVVSGPHD